MTRLMTWFIELQNRFNESRLFKTSTIYVLNRVDDLTLWQVDWMSQRWSRSTWVLCFHLNTDSMNQTDSMNWFTDFWFVDLFKMIIDVTIEFKFFRFILQILLDSDLWNADWLLAFKTTDFNVWIFNKNIYQSFAESIKIWFLFNQRFSMIILCWSKWVINKDIISFLCSCIMIDVYKACVISFWSEVSSYD